MADFSTDFEKLGPARFQRLVQALLVAEFPGLQIFPLNQKDGGRDASVPVVAGADEPLVFQVKFFEDPRSTPDPETLIEHIVAQERANLERLILRGMTEYVVVTNAAGSGMAERGAVDRGAARLAELVPSIKTRIMWRADVDVRLDRNPNLRLRYPELLDGRDTLALISMGAGSEQRSVHERAMRIALATDYEADAKVKFRQVHLQNDLLSLYVDVPCSISRAKKSSTQLLSLAEDLAARFPSDRTNPFGTQIVPSTELLLSLPMGLGDSIVVEGAPGQGKSTLTQALCQYHRSALLQRPDHDRFPDSWQTSAVRLPFRIDLRDLAVFVAGDDPFDGITGWSGLPEGWPRSLSGFLAAQLTKSSGGEAVDVSGLHSLLSGFDVLLAFDGLDEIPDTGARRTVIATVTQGLQQLRQVSQSCVALITTRPSAFAGAPAFARDEFTYLRLESLTIGLATDYAAKWVVARGLDPTDADEVRRILKKRIEEQHCRELARNAMQLAILLTLIYTKGESIPDRRTQLYQGYVDVFFDREAGKSDIVRKYRSALESFHGAIAFELHAEAERRPRGGSIAVVDLRKRLQGHLQALDIEASDWNKLFVGVIERIVALVSRQEGRLEFEVQPLREFFAAKHLYDTAPEGRFGAVPSGTRRERIVALARNPFWLNVTRFMGGFYRDGELAALAEEVEGLFRDDKLQYTDVPRSVAAGLLSDLTFSMAPRSGARVTDALLKGLGTSHAMGSGLFRNSALTVSAGPAKDAIAARAWDLLSGREWQSDRLAAIAQVWINHSSPAHRTEKWLEAVSCCTAESVPYWIAVGLVATSEMAAGEVVPLLRRTTSEGRASALAMLIRFDRTDLFDDDPELYVEALRLIAAGMEPSALYRHTKGLSQLLVATYLAEHRLDVTLHDEAPREFPDAEIGSTVVELVGALRSIATRNRVSKTKLRHAGNLLLEIDSRSPLGLALSFAGRSLRGELDSRVELISRISDASHTRSGALSALTEVEQSDAFIAVASFCACARPSVISGQVVSALSDLVGRLSGSEYEACQTLFMALHNWGPRTAGGTLSARTIDALHPRVICLLLSRQRLSQSQMLGRLGAYRGDDPFVLQTQLACFLHNEASVSDLRPVRKLYAQSTSISGEMQAARRMDHEAVTAVLSKPGEFPLAFSEYAQAVTRSELEQSRKSIKSVSREERWFHQLRER